MQTINLADVPPPAGGRSGSRLGERSGRAWEWPAGLWSTFLWLWRSRVFLLVLGPLLIAAALLSGLDLAYRYGEVEGTRLPGWFSLSVERSFGEYYEYLLTGTASVTLARLCRRNGSRTYGVAALLFLGLLLDNSLELHERGGLLLATAFGFGPHVSHAGEMALLGAGGVVFASATAWSVRAEWPCPNLGGLLVIALAGGAAFFGIVIDGANAVLHFDTPVLKQAAAFIEDGGELVMLVLASAVAFSLALIERRSAGSPPSRQSGGKPVATARGKRD